MTSAIRIFVVASLLLLAYPAAHAQQATAPAAPPTATPQASSGDLDEIVVNGIKRGELIMPTTVTSNSAYGLDLGVMDTPRNNTVLSKAQLDALNIQNPGGFSYLTASSYSDASFGQPNVPRIRGQYSDIFFNGMRDSFTLNGYGAPISFNSVDSIDIIKGPASVQAGPGAGVGGMIDITTKMPTFVKSTIAFNVEGDTQQKARAGFDVNGPLSSTVAARVSFTSDVSGSYYNDMYFHQQSLFVSLLDQITPKYSILVTGGFEDTTYRENDGVNRVNQGLINNGTYLTGPAVTPIEGYGTTIDLTGTTALNNRVIIDEPPGTGAHSVHAKGQIIQTYAASDDFSIVNNSFYDYLNRYNQTMDYYADTAMGSYTFENKTDFKIKFPLGFVSNDIDAGFTYRYAHVLDIQNFLNEPVSVFDLSQSPLTWIFPASAQDPAVLYNAAFNHLQYGLPGRFPDFLNDTIDSNLQDVAIFFAHRMTFSPEWSVIYGLRGDVVQLNESDPLGGPGLYNGLPQKEYTSWYGLYNGNISVVYSPSPRVSTYLTYNNAQYVDSTANDGAVGTFGVSPTSQLRQDTLLYEAGLKFDLLDKALFISTAIYRQKRAVPVGPGGTEQSFAHIRGAEIELNYQPDPHFFATASYSYLHTELDTPAVFWNFPAVPGLNSDGAATGIAWQPNQVYQDPGVPEHLFNLLANYKLDNGFGGQANIQVTGPITTTQSGWINVPGTIANNAFLANPGWVPPNLVAAAAPNGVAYYRSPQIPWQYTLNAAAFYSFADHYKVTFSIYNLTDRSNLINDQSFYGNDFLTRVPPRSFDLSISGRY